MLEVDLVRLDPGLPLPSRAHPDDAGVDLYARADVLLAPGHRALVGTGIALALPPGHAAFVVPRSGLAAREGLGLLNAPGTVDAGYRGEIRVCLVNHDPAHPITVRRGDRVAQLVVQRVENPVFRVLDPGRTSADDGDGAALAVLAAASPTARGAGGFGSSGVRGPAARPGRPDGGQHDRGPGDGDPGEGTGDDDGGGRDEVEGR